MKLEVRDLSFGYNRDKPLWSDVSFSVEKGDIFAIIGANGTGKSTLLRCLIGYLRPNTGSVWLTSPDGERLDSLADQTGFARHIGYVPQVQGSSYSFTVENYVVMGRAPHMGLFQQPKKADYELTDEVLQELGIYDIRNRPFNQLSGGQQRQAVIARAIVQEPDIIIMDEPSNHLDYGNQFRMIQMIEKLAGRGMTVIFTTHMPTHALYAARHVGVLCDSRLYVGPTKEVLTEELLQRVYHIPIKMIYIPEIGRTICVPG